MRRCPRRAAVTCAFALGAFGFAADAAAEPVRLLVSVASKQGLAAERPLKFADNDAARVRDVMVGLGGVKPSEAAVLVEPSRAQLMSAIDRAKIEAQKHRADEVTLVFYFSGHGDRDAIHLGADRVLVSELSAKLAEVPAGLRIAVTDACRATREKGFSDDAPFAISATLIPQASGQVWLHASSDGEAAQESDELQGAIFTHAWLNGLRGAADVNGDARVTLDESFAFAHSQTLIRSAKSSGVLQKPEAIVNLREAAPVVLTQTTTKMATLSLPAARDTHFLVYSAGAKSVLSELWGAPERRMSLRLPPGRYVIQKRAGGAGAAAQIAIAEGEERKLEERDFNAAPLELVARKGIEADEPRAPAPPSAAKHELSAGWDVGANARTGFVHGPRAGYARGWKTFALSIGGALELTNRALEQSEESITAGYGRAAVELRLPASRALAFRAGAGARAGLVAQTLEPNDAAPLGQTTESKTAFAFGPELVLATRLALGSTWFADLAATGSMLFLREEGDLRGIAGVTGAGALGARF